MATADAILQEVCPDLYSRGVTAYTIWLDNAAAQMAAPARWGLATYPYAQANLAAHLWHRATGGSPGGHTPTSAQAVGAIVHESASNGRDAAQMRRDYAPPDIKGISRADQELLKSPWGAEFYRLRQQVPAFGPRNICI